MRVVSVAAVVSAAILATADVANAVNGCGECPAGKLCINVDTSRTLETPTATIPIQFCNYDPAASASYKIEFSPGIPLKCDGDLDLIPVATSLKEGSPCTKDNCIVEVTLKEKIDWAYLLPNGGAVNRLQASITSPTGQDELVQVAKFSSKDAIESIEGNADSAAQPTTCTSKFGVKARQLSRAPGCNKVELCSGKPGDTSCPTPLFKNLTIDDVTCDDATCAGSLTTKALPCDAVGGVLLMNVKVGNGSPSAYARIATLSAPPAATITAVKAEVGSKTIVVESDATCLKENINVTASGFKVTGVDGSSDKISATLDAGLASIGDKLTVTLSQCNAVSTPFEVDVTEATSDPDATAPAASDSDEQDDAGSTAKSGEIGQAGKVSTQTSNTQTGLPNGLYIGIGVGALAFLGFVFECWYHKRKQRQGHHPTGPVAHGAARNAV